MSNKFIPGLSVTDGFDFVKRIWGSLPIPSAVTPTTDLEELDKRINDLRAVEQWLNVNISMLRATIQGLEVQRGTIATLKSFGATLGLKPAEVEEKSAAINNPFASLLNQKQPEPPANPLASATSAASSAATSAASSAAATANQAMDSLTADAKAASAEATANLVSGASAWWGVLQDQINKVAGAAMAAGTAHSDKPKDAKADRPLAGNRPPIRSSDSKPRAATTKAKATAKPRSAPKTGSRAPRAGK